MVQVAYVIALPFSSIILVPESFLFGTSLFLGPRLISGRVIQSGE